VAVATWCGASGLVVVADLSHSPFCM